MELTELKRKYVRELNFITRSDETKKQYKSVLNKFLKDNTRVYRMSTEQLKDYLSEFRSQYSDSYYNVMGSVMKILYVKVLNQPQKMNWFFSIKTKPTYHDIMSSSEFIEIVRKCKNVKHKLMAIILYSTGIRKGELVNIRLTDINYQDNTIFIKSLKHGKNRSVPLHQLTKKYLDVYLRRWNPHEYLFNGCGNLKYSGSSVLQFIKKASNNKYTPHDFRHAFSTLIIEKEGVFSAKKMLGHESLSSTLHYDHISNDRMRNMYNPLDQVYAT